MAAPPVPLIGKKVNTQQLYYNLAIPQDGQSGTYITRKSALPPGQQLLGAPPTTIWGPNKEAAQKLSKQAWRGTGIPGLKPLPLGATAYRSGGWAQEQGPAATLVRTGAATLRPTIGSTVRSGIQEAMPAPPPLPERPPTIVTGLPNRGPGTGAQHRAKGGPILPMGDKNLKKVKSPLDKIKKPIKTKSFKKPKQPKVKMPSFADGGAVERFLAKYPNYNPMD